MRARIANGFTGCALALAALLPATGGAVAFADHPPRLIAEAYGSGFPLSHDAYNGMGAGGDGRIYYVLCSQTHDVAGQMYCFDPATRKVRH
jgi:hypothetical protein